jgi:hypothetical protein
LPVSATSSRPRFVELGVVGVGQLAGTEAADRFQRHRFEHPDAAVGHVGEVDELAVGRESGIVGLRKPVGELGELGGAQGRLRAGQGSQEQKGREDDGAHGGFPRKTGVSRAR